MEQFSISYIDQILGQFSQSLGNQFRMYRNHVCRVVSFSFKLSASVSSHQKEKIIIAGCFHDLGIWTHRTFDYLMPSVSLANDYLKSRGLEGWQNEIAAMIENHHRVTSFHRETSSLVELFRKADWIDVSLGMLSFGLPSVEIKEVKSRYPNAGFHRRLTALTIKAFIHHPLKPLPMMKW